MDEVSENMSVKQKIEGGTLSEYLPKLKKKKNQMFSPVSPLLTPCHSLSSWNAEEAVPVQKVFYTTTLVVGKFCREIRCFP